VPAIIWSLALLMSLNSWSFAIFEQAINISIAKMFFTGVLFYYLALYWKLAIGLLLFIIPTVITAEIVAANENALVISIVVFVIAWIIQFIGHYYEKAKPAFVDDLNQLLIGPFFLMAEIYFMLGLEKKLEKEIIPMAIEKRRALEVANKKALE